MSFETINQKTCCHCNKLLYGYNEFRCDPQWYVPQINVPPDVERFETFILFIWTMSNTINTVCGGCYKKGIEYLYVVY